MTVKTFYRLFVGLLIVAYAWLIYVFLHIEGQGGVSPCLSKLFFHIPCPACGTTRGVMCIAKGYFWDAFCMNPNAYLVFVGTLFVTVMMIYDGISGSRTLYKSYLYFDGMMHKKVLLSVFLLIEVVIWAFNIYRGI